MLTNLKKLGIWAVVVVVVCALGILWFDRPVFNFLRGFDWWPWHIMDMFFATKVWLLVFAIFAAIIFIKKTQETKNKHKSITNKLNVRNIFVKFKEYSKTNPAFFIFCSVLFASVITGVLKVIIGRARPVFFEALGHTGFYPPNFEWAFNSMPSGHTAASFAGLVAIYLLLSERRKARNEKRLSSFVFRFSPLALAVLIGMSRICVGDHWPSDVILGAFIGIVSVKILDFRV